MRPSVGVFGSAVFSFDLIVNYKSGEISLAGGPGLQGGLGNGAQYLVPLDTSGISGRTTRTLPTPTRPQMSKSH